MKNRDYSSSGWLQPVVLSTTIHKIYVSVCVLGGGGVPVGCECENFNSNGTTNDWKKTSWLYHILQMPTVENVEWSEKYTAPANTTWAYSNRSTICLITFCSLSTQDKWDANRYAQIPCYTHILPLCKCGWNVAATDHVRWYTDGLGP